MKLFFRRKFEAALLRLAAFIIDRNVERCMVISRRHNNELFEIPFRLNEIAQHISEGYSKCN